jgi:5-(carboxyamino)imidazole ribonucleotide synthase
VTLVACIGGGQLGRMLGLAGIQLGLRFRFLDPAADACAGDVGELLVASYDDGEALLRLADEAAVVTFEFENVPVAAAAAVGAVPGARALSVAQDRLHEKELFRQLGIPTPRFGDLEVTGLPALVKTRRFGYDGKGQRRVDAAEPLGDDELAEELVPFDRELSIVGVRGSDGETRFWPLTENVHRDGILAVSRAPAAEAPQEAAEEIARSLLDELDYVGVLAVELFDVDGRLLANELAPRVHNTGHWTIDGATTSQFENHLRALLGLPLGVADAVAPSVMVNLVGASPPLDELTALPGAHVHLYGKEPRSGRKLGHVTLVGAPDEAVRRALELAASSWC